MSDVAVVFESLGARARRFAFPVPDAMLALLYALAAFGDVLPHEMTEALAFGILIEGGFLLMQATLVDIATRLKKRPPFWLIPIMVGAILLFMGGSAWEVLKMAWDRGMAFFLPLLLSLLERGYILWQMPVRTRVQKIAARALIGNRIVTGIALCVLTLVASIALDSVGEWLVFSASALYFGIAAYDDARVRRPKFAERPRVLFRYDVLHIEYLEPL